MAAAGRGGRTEHFRDTVKGQAPIRSRSSRSGGVATSFRRLRPAVRVQDTRRRSATARAKTGAGESTRPASPSSLVDRQRTTWGFPQLTRLSSPSPAPPPRTTTTNFHLQDFEEVLPQGTDRGAQPGGAATGQGAAGRRDQALERRLEDARRLRPQNARRARCRHARPGGVGRACLRAVAAQSCRRSKKH